MTWTRQQRHKTRREREARAQLAPEHRSAFQPWADKDAIESELVAAGPGPRWHCRFCGVITDAAKAYWHLMKCEARRTPR